MANYRKEIEVLVAKYQKIVNKNYEYSFDKEYELNDLFQCFSNPIKCLYKEDLDYISNFFEQFIYTVFNNKGNSSSLFYFIDLNIKNVNLFLNKELLKIVLLLEEREVKGYKNNIRSNCIELVKSFVIIGKTDFADFIIKNIKSDNLSDFIKRLFLVNWYKPLKNKTHELSYLKTVITNIANAEDQSLLLSKINELVSNVKISFEELMVRLETNDLINSLTGQAVTKIGQSYPEHIKETIEFLLYLNSNYETNIEVSKSLFQMILLLFRSTRKRELRYKELKNNLQFYSKLFSSLYIVDKLEYDEKENISGYFIYHILSPIYQKNDCQLMYAMLESLSKNKYVKDLDNVFLDILPNINKPSAEMWNVFDSFKNYCSASVKSKLSFAGDGENVFDKCLALIKNTNYLSRNPFEVSRNNPRDKIQELISRLNSITEVEQALEEIIKIFITIEKVADRNRLSVSSSEFNIEIDSDSFNEHFAFEILDNLFAKFGIYETCAMVINNDIIYFYYNSHFMKTTYEKRFSNGDNQDGYESLPYRNIKFNILSDVEVLSLLRIAKERSIYFEDILESIIKIARSESQTDFLLTIMNAWLSEKINKDLLLGKLYELCQIKIFKATDRIAYERQRGRLGVDSHIYILANSINKLALSTISLASQLADNLAPLGSVNLNEIARIMSITAGTILALNSKVFLDNSYSDKKRYYKYIRVCINNNNFNDALRLLEHDINSSNDFEEVFANLHTLTLLKSEVQPMSLEQIDFINSFASKCSDMPAKDKLIKRLNSIVVKIKKEQK